jgi:hypothetical protein
LEAYPGAVEGLYACVADLHPFDEGLHSRKRMFRIPARVKFRSDGSVLRICINFMRIRVTFRKKKKYVTKYSELLVAGL